MQLRRRHSHTLFPRLMQSEQGTSVIELAVAAPVLLMFLVGITDLGRGLTERYRLQQAVNRTLEMAQTGRDAEYITLLKTEGAAAAGVPEDNVVPEQWVQCGGDLTTRRAWTEDCAGGESARFVKLTITGSFTPLFGTIGYSSAQPDGTVRLTAHATLRVR